MLVGSIITVIGQVSRIFVQMIVMPNFSASGNMQWLTATAAISGLGGLLFAIGLLLYALHPRGKANRIAELESILNSRQS